MKCCHHLLASERVKEEGPHMQRPWGSEEAIRKVVLWSEWREHIEERKGTEEASKGQDFCVQGMHLGSCCPADSGCPWKLMKAYI